jgi:hypothetical protein
VRANQRPEEGRRETPSIPAANRSRFALTLTLVGVPVAVHQLTGDDASRRTDLLAAAGAVQWNDEPSAEALLKAGVSKAKAEQFYFVLPDRFANGDPRNDRGGLTGDRLSTGLDPPTRASTTAATSRASSTSSTIEGMGTTAIWLAPIFKNRPVQGAGADVSAGYHGYWITDFTQVDPHFGTNANSSAWSTFPQARYGFLDVIANHTADIITRRGGTLHRQEDLAVHRRPGAGL